MKKFYIIFLSLLLLSGCNRELNDNYDLSYDNKTTLNIDNFNNEDKEASKDKSLSWLFHYDGRWEIKKVYAYFFPNEDEDSNITSNSEDEYVGMQFTINSENEEIIFDNGDKFKMIEAKEVTSNSLSWMIFAPKWGILANTMASEICGNGNIEKDIGTEQTAVKFIMFSSNNPKSFKHNETIAIIVTTNGDLFFNIRDAGGTYSLSRQK